MAQEILPPRPRPPDKSNPAPNKFFCFLPSSSIQDKENSAEIIADVLAKARFWQSHAASTISERQRKVVNRLLDAGKGGFHGGLTTRKYVSMAKVSRATAFREISDLLQKGVLLPNPAKGRSVSYAIKRQE